MTARGSAHPDEVPRSPCASRASRARDRHGPTNMIRDVTNTRTVVHDARTACTTQGAVRRLLCRRAHEPTLPRYLEAIRLDHALAVPAGAASGGVHGARRSQLR